MTPAAIISYSVLILWGLGGTIWLLRRRSYRLDQIPQFAMDLLGFPVELSQSLWGRAGVPYALLLPNMLIFGFFTFLPMILNFYVSFTGGSSISLFDRPMVGGENYARIFDCESYFNPKTCSNEGFSFWRGMFNTLLFVGIQVPVLVAAALATALVVNKSLIGRGFWRAMFFYPVMLSPVVIANIWNWMLHRKGLLNKAMDGGAEGVTALAGMSGFDLVMTVFLGILLMLTSERALRSGPATAASREPSFAWAAVFGALFIAVASWANPLQLVTSSDANLSFWAAIALVGGLLWLIASGRPFARPAIMALGVVSIVLLLTIQFASVFDFSGFRPVNWLVTPNTGWPMFWLVFVFTWSHMGFYMLILLAGLQAIPQDLYEAAKMDATKPARAFFRITLPLVMPTLTVVLVLSLIRAFQIFDEVWLLTGGGPGRETFMIVQHIYETAFVGDNPAYGEAAAGSVLMAIVIAIFTGFQLLITRRQSGI
jgi:ABC-type sugar transport system permease subunit